MRNHQARPGGGESSLHAALKAQLRQPEDASEAVVEGYRIDILRGGTLIEIQTGNFHALKPKLEALLPRYRVHVVYPVAREKWIVRQTREGITLARRKSPRRGRLLDVCRELVYLADLLTHPNLSLEVLFIHQEDVWRDDGKGSWRRKGWSVSDRRLLAILDSRSFSVPADFAALLPDLEEPFTCRAAARALDVKPRLARQLVYTLQRCGVLETVGKKRNARLYQRLTQEARPD